MQIKMLSIPKTLGLLIFFNHSRCYLNQVRPVQLAHLPDPVVGLGGHCMSVRWPNPARSSATPQGTSRLVPGLVLAYQGLGLH